MPATYEPIATTTLGSAASTITFSSIPATYTDLRLILVAFGNGTASNQPRINYNSITGTSYSYTLLNGTGTTANSARGTNDSYFYLRSTAISNSIPTMATVDIFSYTGSTNKTTLITNGTDGATNYVEYQVGLWRQTSAINRIDISSTVTMGTGTTATLYGILKA